MSGEVSWMDGDARDSLPSASREMQRQKALDVARLYLVFKEDARCRELLSIWDKTLRRRRIAADSSLQVYAAHNALRDFVEGIHEQIEFAQNEGKLK